MLIANPDPSGRFARLGSRDARREVNRRGVVRPSLVQYDLVCCFVILFRLLEGHGAVILCEHNVEICRFGSKRRHALVDIPGPGCIIPR